MPKSQSMQVYYNEKVKHSFVKRRNKKESQHKFDIHTHPTIKRRTVECYINQRFNQVYQANIHHFMPILLEVSLKESLQATIGLTPGYFKHFYLEQYLLSSAESLLSELTQQPIERHSIIEIGNLATSHDSSGLILFSLMTSLLNKAQYEWIIFTATDEVKRLLERLNITLIPISLAQQNVEQSHWGEYYKNNPQVMAADLKKIFSDNEKLLNQINRKYLDNMSNVYHQLKNFNLYPIR
ncbi:thermostable hemolysin [uncultured Shewanella sp.]|uniref:thermostable hemolysin n=1 Tax=uncultured Shewanella sp. TaxID=173975 RepID=UPI0026335FCD|nr:thermostable hemolysin [uncultured Shewanella sp.]